jgi:DNA-binding LacI/PurR family transcriptional regulator
MQGHDRAAGSVRAKRIKDQQETKVPRAPVTMKDIARAAGVGQSTVSRILNNTPLTLPVSAETRERVLALAQEAGYRPNPFARALRGGPTMLIGAIVRDITDPFFAVAIDHLARSANRHGYSLVLGHAQASVDEALALAGVLQARQSDGILLVGDFRHEPQLLEDLERGTAPVVAMWHGQRRISFHSVEVDNRQGVHLAMDHLRALGHSRIAFLGGESLGDIRDREAAYREYLHDAGDSYRAGYVRRAANTFRGPEAALRRFLNAREAPSAIVAATDVQAIGLLQAAALSGVRIPEDLSIVGFDDIPFAAATTPPLTTVRMPVGEMANAAIELILEARGATKSAQAITLAPTLVIRGSTAPPPA